MTEIKQQDLKLFEPDFDNINTIDDIKTLFKALYIQINYDMNNERDASEANNLLAKKIIKETSNAKLIIN